MLSIFVYPANFHKLCQVTPCLAKMDIWLSLERDFSQTWCLSNNVKALKLKQK